MHDLEPLLEFVRLSRKTDISAYNHATLKRCLEQRLNFTGCKSLKEYLELLHQQSCELDSLLDVLTNNFSHFYRDPLTFEYIEQKILPAILFEKKKTNDRMLRIWSAGCASGEEPYSIAILVKHLVKEVDSELKAMIFGTDIDKSILAKAREASFPPEAIKHVKYEFLEKYFTKELSRFKIADEIRKLVLFSRHDLTDSGSKVPSDSVYGDFDMVFCRNVLIYFREETQRNVIEKFHHSLAQNGYLVLGRAEEVLADSWGSFKKVTDACPIFQKVGSTLGVP